MREKFKISLLKFWLISKKEQKRKTYLKMVFYNKVNKIIAIAIFPNPIALIPTKRTSRTFPSKDAIGSMIALYMCFLQTIIHMSKAI